MPFPISLMPLPFRPFALPRTQAPAGAPNGVGGNTAASDSLKLSTPTAKPVGTPAAPPFVGPPKPKPTLAEQIVIVERLIGQKIDLKTKKELEAYLASVEGALPQEAYDREGFLSSIGMNGVQASGREDKLTLDAVRAKPDYKPGTELGGKPIGVQQWIFNLAIKKPKLYLKLTKVANPVIETPARIQGRWHKPFTPAQTAVPTGVTAAARYPDAYKKLDSRFENDFHSGIPAFDDPNPRKYGTYTIAQAVGMTQEQARRVAEMAVGIDYNVTPYGKTSPNPLHALDRHFNLDRGGQDTRLVWAARHLDAAVAYAKQGAFDQAEIELGCGLHSMQDLFAHGQLSPSLHGTLGEYPDTVSLNPIGTYEATEATGAYLKAYFEAIRPAAVAPATAPTPAPTPAPVKGPQP